MSRPRSLNKVNLDKDDEAILKNFIVTDFDAAIAYAAEISERKEIPDSKICRDLISVVNHNKFKTKMSKINKFWNDTEGLLKRTEEYQSLMAIALKEFNILIALELLGNVLDINEQCKQIENSNTKKIHDLSRDMILSIFNAANVEKYPIELLNFACKYKDIINTCFEALKFEIIGLLNPRFRGHVKLLAFSGITITNSDESKKASPFWHGKTIGEIVRLAQLDSNRDTFLNNFNRIESAIHEQLIKISQFNFEGRYDDLIASFSLFETRNPNYFILISSIAFHAIHQIKSKEHLVSFNDLRVLAALYKGLYDHNKAHIILDTQIDVLKRYLATMKDLASHKARPEDYFLDITESLSIMIKDDSDPIRTIFTQRTLNEICREALAIGSNRSLLASTGYPLAIHQAIEEALTRNGREYSRGILVGCYALVMLTQYPERTQQHFGLLDGEKSSLLILRSTALEYIAAHSAKWPEFKNYFEKNNHEGSLYPLSDLLNHEHSLKREDVIFAIRSLLNMEIRSFERYEKLLSALKAHDAAKRKSASKESKAEFIAQPQPVLPRSQPNRGSGILNEIEGAAPGQAEMKTLTLTLDKLDQNQIPTPDQMLRFEKALANFPVSAWDVFLEILNSANAAANEDINRMFHILITKNAINDKERWDHAFSFYSQQLKKLQGTHNSANYMSPIVDILKMLAKSPFANIEKVDEVILKHYIVADFEKAVAYAQEAHVERKEIPDSKICRDLIVVANRNEFKTKQSKIHTFKNDSAGLLKIIQECHALGRGHIHVSLYDNYYIHTVLNMLSDVFKIIINVNIQHGDSEDPNIKAMLHCSRDIILSIFNSKNMESYPIELLDFAFNNNDVISKYFKECRFDIDLVLLHSRLKRHPKLLAFTGAAIAKPDESKKAPPFWHGKTIGQIVELAQLPSNHDTFLNNFDSIKLAIYCQLDGISHFTFDELYDDLIKSFSLFETFNPTYFVLIHSIATYTIRLIESKEDFASLHDLRTLAALYKGLYDNGNAYLIDETQIGVLRKYLSVVKDLSDHPQVSADDFLALAKFVRDIVEKSTDPVRTLLARQAFNEICCRGYAAGRSGRILAYLQYPPAIGATVCNALSGESNQRGMLLGCYALLMLTQDPELTRQHFGLLHDEMNSLCNLRTNAEKYIEMHSATWPTFKTFFDTNKEFLKQGSLYPFTDLEKKRLFALAEFKSAFKEFVDLAPKQFANLSADVERHNAVERKAESKVESVAKPKEDEPKQQEGVLSKVIPDFAERKEGEPATVASAADAVASPFPRFDDVYAVSATPAWVRNLVHVKIPGQASVEAPAQPREEVKAIPLSPSLSALSFLAKSSQDVNPPAIMPAQPQPVLPRSQPNRSSGILNEIEGGALGQPEVETLTLTIIGFDTDTHQQVGKLRKEDVPYNSDDIMQRIVFAMTMLKVPDPDKRRFNVILKNSSGDMAELPIPPDAPACKSMIEKLLNGWLVPSALNIPAEQKEEQPGGAFQLRRGRGA